MILVVPKPLIVSVSGGGTVTVGNNVGTLAPRSIWPAAKFSCAEDPGVGAPAATPEPCKVSVWAPNSIAPLPGAARLFKLDAVSVSAFSVG